MRIIKISWLVLFSTILCFPFHSFSTVRQVLKIPLQIKFDVYKGGEKISKAAFFYRPNTKIKRFGRELSSARLVFFQEIEQDFNYLFESYFFLDNSNLYLDSTSNRHRVIRQVELKKTIPTRNNIQRGLQHYFYEGAQGKVSPNNKSSSLVSTILYSLKKIMRRNYDTPEDLNYINKKEIQSSVLHFQREKLIEWKGKQCPVRTMELIADKAFAVEIDIFQTSDNALLPLRITLNPAEKNPMILLLDPATSPLDAKKIPMTASFLNFIEADTGSFDQTSVVHRLLYNEIKKEIHQELNKIAAQENKRLIGHQLPNVHSIMQGGTQRLLNLTFDPSMPYEEKYKRINDIAKNHSLGDVIVIGQYVDNPGSPWTMIRPVIIFPSKKRILTKNLLFKRSDTICPADGNQPNTLCNSAYQAISQKISHLFLSGIDEKFGERGMTYAAVHLMLSQNNFFVMPMGFGYQYESLLRQQQNLSISFSDGRQRQRTRVKGKDFLIKTISTDKNNPIDMITLFWAPLEGGLLTVQDARRMIDRLNETKYQGHSDWRLPSIDELFSISGYYNEGRNFFPFFHSQKNRKIWTSTPLAEVERKNLSLSKNDIYFIARCTHQSDNHFLHYDVLDITQQAYAFPVRAKLSRRTQKFEEKQRKLNIAQISFIDSKNHFPITSNELSSFISIAVKKGIDMACSLNQKITPYAKNDTFNTTANANNLTDIFFKPDIPKNAKINKIIQQIMIPNQIDLLITGYVINNDDDPNITLRPTIVSKYDQKLKVKNFSLGNQQIILQKHSMNAESTKQVINLIAHAIRDLLLQA